MTFTVDEKVNIAYKIVVDEEKFKKLNKSMEEYLDDYLGDPWMAMEADDIIIAINFDEIVE